MATTASAVVAKAPTASPYQLDKAQVLKASSSLIKHIKSEAKRKEQSSGKKSLLAATGSDSDGEDDAAAESVWLQVTTKKHIVDKKRLKPSKILLPHTLNSSTTSICLITPDPQRAFKDVLEQPSFPQSLAKQIRILGVAKLKTRYKSFESRRQLLSEYDVFLADDRVVTVLPRLLGKIFFETSKRPVPVRLEGYKPKDSTTGKRAKSSDKGASNANKSTASPALFAKEIEKALSSARIHLSPSVTTSVRVGFSNFSGQQLAENVEAVVNGMIEKFITKGWKNVRTIHIKGPNTAALPIWMSDELWVEEDDVIEDAEAEAFKVKAIESSDKSMSKKKGTKRKDRELEKKPEGANGEGELTPSAKKKQKRLAEEEEGFSREMAERRQKLREAKEEVRKQAESKLDAEFKISLPPGIDEETSGAKKTKKNKGKKGAKTAERPLVLSAAA